MIVTCLVWNEAAWDIAGSFTIWESLPGYVILVARMLIYLWFVYTTGATLLRFNRKKKAFYGLFFIVYSVWLVALPITCLVSSQLLPRMYQAKVLFAVNNIVAMLAQLILLILYIPNLKCSARFFPFHATHDAMEFGSVFKEKTTLDSDEEKGGDDGGKKLVEVYQDKDKQKGSKLVPTNSKGAGPLAGPPIARKRKKVKRIISRVLTDNPTHRIDYRLDSVLFRLDRLFTTVFAMHRTVQRIIAVSPEKKPEAKDAGFGNTEEKKSDDSARSRNQSNSRPIRSSNSAAALRWKQAKGIRDQSATVMGMRVRVDSMQNDVTAAAGGHGHGSRRSRSRY